MKVIEFLDIDAARKRGFSGVKVVGSANVSTFLNACFGFYPWDGMHDKHYFDKMLIHPSKKPKNLVYKSS